MAFSATNNELLLVEQFAILINLVSLFHLHYMVFVPRKVMNDPVTHWKICAMP